MTRPALTARQVEQRRAAARAAGADRKTASAGRVARTADNKGRVALGGRFANRPVILEQLSETEVVVKLARVIPESEAWLYDNAAALRSVRDGLAQARQRKLTKGPDVDRDARLAAQLED